MLNQCAPSTRAEPASTKRAGSKASNSVSSMRSTAHMPRVIRLTMEPAKLFACQSVDKRWMRQKASEAISDINPTVRRETPMIAT